MKPNALTIARYVGIAAAALVPALVVAQQTQFNAGSVLTATSLRNLETRIGQLEAQALSKQRLLEATLDQALVQPGEVALVTASCDPGEIVLGCLCTGSAGSQNLDLRIAGSNNQAANSNCQCRAQNVGTVAETLIASASCFAP